MQPSRIGQLVRALHHAKQRGARLTGHTGPEKELRGIIHGHAIPLTPTWTPGIYNPDGSEAVPPPRYEDDFLAERKEVMCT